MGKVTFGIILVWRSSLATSCMHLHLTLRLGLVRRLGLPWSLGRHVKKMRKFFFQNLRTMQSRNMRKKYAEIGRDCIFM